MAQYRQYGAEKFAGRVSIGSWGKRDADQIGIIGIRSSYRQGRLRRFARTYQNPKALASVLLLVFLLVLVITVFAYTHISGDKASFLKPDGGSNLENDLISQATHTKKLRFGQGSIHHGLDSRYWDRDDRRRDLEFDEDTLEHNNRDERQAPIDDNSVFKKEKSGSKYFSMDTQTHLPKRAAVGLYNEAGRNELKQYEVEYEASIKMLGLTNQENSSEQNHNASKGLSNNEINSLDDYDDGLVLKIASTENPNSGVHQSVDKLDLQFSRTQMESPANKPESAQVEIVGINSDESVKLSGSSEKSFLRRRSKHKKFSSSACEIRFLNTTAELIEPIETKKFARFSLQYTDIEVPTGENWEPRFAGHQSLQEREESFVAHDQRINCGFVRGPKSYPTTGFDMAEDDVKFMHSCHIAVSSCIFGDSDNLRTPTKKVITRISRKNVCFVMFMDENTLQALTSEGKVPDKDRFIGLWKIVVVKNLPYDDMRRVGKIPKFLTHRLFPYARYSIWLDSKLRLQSDPMLILEYLLWRKNYEYAISNHYDRHCVWEEVMQNKKLNKFNHTMIDQQFEFYQADGLKKFNFSDPGKLLPSYVPEGSFIVRAHTPMSNLFSCLWFNEVDRFTPRDQLSFAYTFLKLRRTNPAKPFYLNMFKDCERRSIVKLFHHKPEDKRSFPVK